MGRVTLLFGEWSGDPGGGKIPRHVPPDGRRPLRMQAGGEPRARRRRAYWKGRLWARALRSAGARRRAGILGMVAVLVQMVMQIEWWRIALIGGAIVAVALVSGAWTEVAMLAEALERGRN